MLKRTRNIVVAMIAGAGLAVVPMTPAFAINRVNCTNPDFLTLVSRDTTCWANRGAVAVRLHGVSDVRTGSNPTTLTFADGSRRSWPPRTSAHIFGNRTVTQIRIG